MLIDKGICPLICKLLILMHTDQNVCIRWASTYSPPFSVSNGVKQGENVSPVHFLIYSDTTLDELKKSKLGCHITNIFVGALAYANDIVLISSSRTALSEMLDIAAKSSFDLNLNFNPGKCQLLKFDKSRRPAAYPNDVHVDFCNQRVDISTSALHLGHYFGAVWVRDDTARSTIYIVGQMSFFLNFNTVAVSNSINQCNMLLVHYGTLQTTAEAEINRDFALYRDCCIDPVDRTTHRKWWTWWPLSEPLNRLALFLICTSSSIPFHYTTMSLRCNLHNYEWKRHLKRHVI